MAGSRRLRPLARPARFGRQVMYYTAADIYEERVTLQVASREPIRGAMGFRMSARNGPVRAGPGPAVRQKETATAHTWGIWAAEPLKPVPCVLEAPQPTSTSHRGLQKPSRRAALRARIIE